MIFGAVPTATAQGTILAHSLRLGPDRLAKGTHLSAEHVARLQAAGVQEVTVARLEPGDIEENAAAAQLAQALAPDPAALGVRITGAGAGRVNLYATGPGIVRIDAARIGALNAIDPMITLATLADATRVDPGTMLGTIKIISYAVSQASLDNACADVAGAIGIDRPRFASATLIETHVPETEHGPKGRAAMQERLSRLDVDLTPPVHVAHCSAALAEAIAAAPGAVVFILTASATSDIADVAPAALRAAGGQVEAFGMPVDPGNLLFFGWLGAKPVIGLPGCARSPALNGADWVTERLICGRDVTQADISAMGAGGLLKEIPTRPRPRRERPART